MIFLLPFLFAEEPKYTNLKKDEPAPWAGRLLNEAALRILVEENATKDLTCDARVEFKMNEVRIEEKYRYDILKVQTDAENNIWPVVAGFVGGAAISIGIMYAVKPGITQ
jgi:hypothetical protein